MFLSNLINILVLGEKCSKSTTSYMKIRLNIVRRKRIATVNFLKTDIVNFLNNGQDSQAYKRVIKISSFSHYTSKLYCSFRFVICQLLVTTAGRSITRRAKNNIVLRSHRAILRLYL